MRWAVFAYNPFYQCDTAVAYFVHRDDAVTEAVRVGGLVVDMHRARWPAVINPKRNSTNNHQHFHQTTFSTKESEHE